MDASLLPFLLKALDKRTFTKINIDSIVNFDNIDLIKDVLVRCKEYVDYLKRVFSFVNKRNDYDLTYEYDERYDKIINYDTFISIIENPEKCDDITNMLKTYVIISNYYKNYSWVNFCCNGAFQGSFNIFCTNCESSSNCIKCIDCKNCTDCINCIDCNSCGKCNNIIAQNNRYLLKK